MGEGLGRSLRDTGVRVVWASKGRSDATAARAAASGFEDVGTLDAMRACDVIVSICPPEFALDVAESVAGIGFDGVYVDANAVSPATAAAVDKVVRRSGASFVDGGVIGGPESPRVFLCGAGADELAAMFGVPATAVVLDGPDYGASSLKMLYAGWTKGTTALLFALRAAADALGVDDALAEEWSRSQTALAPRLERAGPSAAKAWRWSGEMREIAATLAAVGLPADFHAGAADVYERLAPLKDDPRATIDDVVRLVLPHHPDTTDTTDTTETTDTTRSTETTEALP
jgi:3-hydroxyisobutyrate dehydrogenase-like beta-hydroxyacid dehydrogenase